MKFKISKKEFLDILNLASRAISNTTPLPSLSGIKITLTNNSLIVISSDSNISIKSAINNNDTSVLIIEEPGEIVIDSKYLLEIIRKIGSDFVQFEIIDGSLVKISGGNSEFKINGIDASEYPNINFNTSNTTPFKLKTSLFKQIIEETSFACSDKDTRPVLTGVNLKVLDGKLYANATDSFRLASKTVEIENVDNINITVPAKYLSEVYHSLNNEEEITIAFDKQKISFIFNNTIIETRLLDDVFPDVSRLIPLGEPQKLKVSSKDLSNAIDRTSFIKSDGKNIIKLKIDASKIEITASNQIGSAYEIVNVLSFTGDALEISCSGKYLQDALKAIDSDEVEIDFYGELKPMILKSNNDETLVQLISPVRTYK